MPDWIERLPIPTPNPALADRPAQALLVSHQSRYERDHHDHFVELAFLIQNTQGLQGLGTVRIPWQPDQADLIVHKVQIVRAGNVIDLLANGQDFAVLRRENNLEAAMLDGVLTAVMQAEGLQIGDVINIAYTMRRRAGGLPLRGENSFMIAPGATVRRFHARQFWSPQTPLRWRGSGLLENARERAVRGGRELVLDLQDVEGTPPPESAPPRFFLAGSLQLTEYRDWAEVAALLAPHYERAATLADGSSLRAEIARIAAASSDPRQRAMAALRLVQDQVRYFALVMGDGNYLPASADQTWSRRYGDCKGKTALLLALLHGLGIDAEPVLVNTAMGDALDQRLPQMGMFDHVIVRARIDGRSFWLDGTRTGDRNLEDLASSPLGWGLPVLTAGAVLERLPYAPPQHPLMEVNITYDGTPGFAEPVPVVIETVLRGDFAVAMRARHSQVGREEFLRQIREQNSDLPGDEDEVTSVDFRDDADGGTFVLIIRGKTRMDWRSVAGAASRRFRLADDSIRWDANFERTSGRNRDAPFAFGIPTYSAQTETVLLPNGGQGFSFDGQSFDQVVAGTRISRQLSITGNRAVARSAFQRLQPEVSAAAALAEKPTLETINRDEAYLRAPPGMPFRPSSANAPPPTSASTARSEIPATAEALVESGFQKMQANRNREALADFDRAIALSPEWGRAHANRGVALTHLNRLDDAETALATALRLDADDFVVHQGLGYLNLRRDRPEQALAALSRSLELDRDNIFTLQQRMDAYERLGRFDDALRDIAQLLTFEPRHAMAMAQRARILAHLDREAEAMAALDAALASDPGNYALLLIRAELLLRFRRQEEANRAYQAAIEAFDRMMATMGVPADQIDLNRLGLLGRAGRRDEAIALADAHLRRYPGAVMTLAARCLVRAEGNVELERALRDCNEAIRAEPDHIVATPARGLANLRLQRWADAIRDFDTAVEQDSAVAMALYGRAIARRQLGDVAGADRDLAQARRHMFDIDAEYVRLGFEPLPRPTGPSVTAPRG